MQPLSPQDQLIRRAAAESDESGDDRKPIASGPTVPLERFQTLEHTIRDVPLNVEPYLELAQIYLQSQRWLDARRVSELACKRFPTDETACFYLEEAQLSRSFHLCQEAQREHTREPTQLTEQHLQRCRLELNVLREKVCISRMERNPKRVDLNLPLAIALTNLGRGDEAVRRLQMAVEVPELRAAAALQLGRTLEHLGRVPAALSAYRRAALFRVPPPTREIKIEALTAAAELAERKNLIDSARRYTRLLAEAMPEEEVWQHKLRELEERPL